MSVNRVRHEIRSARYRSVNRTGLTVNDLRAFLAEADEAEIPDSERVRVNVELASEGGSKTVVIEASVTVLLGKDAE